MSGIQEPPVSVDNEHRKRRNEGIPGSPEGDDNESNGGYEPEIADQVFSIPMILKQILEELNRKDLLITSLVNKLWNIWSREVLRKENCLAVIRQDNPCGHLYKLNRLLANSETVPFNGLSISFRGEEGHHNCCRFNNQSDFTSQILSKIEVKYLSLRVHAMDAYDNYSFLRSHARVDRTCRSVQAAREILLTRASFLQGVMVDIKELDMDRYSDDLQERFLNALNLGLVGHWLPTVQVLEFPYNFHHREKRSDTTVLVKPKTMPVLLKVFVEASPNLKKLYGNINVKCLHFILSLNLARAVKHFYFEPNRHLLDTVMKFALEKPELERITFATDEIEKTRWHYSASDKIVRYDYDPSDVIRKWTAPQAKRVPEIVRLLLTSSANSLETFGLAHLDLILLTDQWGIPSLPRLKNLIIDKFSRLDSTSTYFTLQRIDWNTHFPNLHCVTVLARDKYCKQEAQAYYIKDSFRARTARYKCETVTKLSLLGRTEDQFCMFKTIFPNVKEFYMEQCDLDSLLASKLWVAWKNLEVLHLSIDLWPSDCNFDFFFVGIFAQEANILLKEVKAADFGNLEIVPRRACLADATALKKLVLKLNHYCDRTCDRSDRSVSTSGSFFLSELTGQCVFNRKPELVVEVDRALCDGRDNCYLAMHHLAPFVKFAEDTTLLGSEFDC